MGSLAPSFKAQLLRVLAKSDSAFDEWSEAFVTPQSSSREWSRHLFQRNLQENSELSFKLFIRDTNVSVYT